MVIQKISGEMSDVCKDNVVGPLNPEQPELPYYFNFYSNCHFSLIAYDLDKGKDLAKYYDIAVRNLQSGTTFVLVENSGAFSIEKINP
jgi:hypothetical protein